MTEIEELKQQIEELEVAVGEWFALYTYVATLQTALAYKYGSLTLNEDEWSIGKNMFESEIGSATVGWKDNLLTIDFSTINPEELEEMK